MNWEGWHCFDEIHVEIKKHWLPTSGEIKVSILHLTVGNCFSRQWKFPTGYRGVAGTDGVRTPACLAVSAGAFSRGSTYHSKHVGGHYNVTSIYIHTTICLAWQEMAQCWTSTGGYSHIMVDGNVFTSPLWLLAFISLWSVSIILLAKTNAGPTLYKCYTHVLCLLGKRLCALIFW